MITTTFVGIRVPKQIYDDILKISKRHNLKISRTYILLLDAALKMRQRYKEIKADPEFTKKYAEMFDIDSLIDPDKTFPRLESLSEVQVKALMQACQLTLNKLTHKKHGGR